MYAFAIAAVFFIAFLVVVILRKIDGVRWQAIYKTMRQDQPERNQQLYAPFGRRKNKQSIWMMITVFFTFVFLAVGGMSQLVGSDIPGTLRSFALVFLALGLLFAVMCKLSGRGSHVGDGMMSLLSGILALLFFVGAGVTYLGSVFAA